MKEYPKNYATLNTDETVYTGNFICINDVYPEDDDRWYKLLGSTKYTSGELFNRLLDAYEYYTNPNTKPDEPTEPEDPSGEGGATTTTAKGMIHNCCSTVSIFPGKTSKTNVFGLFSVETSTTVSPRNIHVRFTDFNPDIKCKAIKMDCVQFNDILQTYYTTDLSNVEDKEFDISLEKYGTVSHVALRIYYEIVDYEIPEE